jgi:glycolate oxidase FAD binding subunit
MNNESILERLRQKLNETAEIRAGQEIDAVDGVRPAAVAAPRTEDAARELVLRCAADDLKLVVRGGGTKIGQGAPPTSCDVLLETRCLDTIFEHDEGNATVSVGAGITLKVLNEAVGQRGQFAPLEGNAAATLGGIVATNSYGPSRLKYGAPRDLVVGLHAILSDGRVVKGGGKVVKNVSGYDLPKLFIGSFGSLGLITRITLRLRPYDEAHWEWNAIFADWPEAEAQAKAIFEGAFEPTSLQLLSTSGGVVVQVAFDGVEAAINIQRGRLPVSVDADGAIPPELAESGSVCIVRAALPIQAASAWASAARLAGGELTWDYGLGRVTAAFAATPDISVLRMAAEREGGYMVVLHAPHSEKTPELVWGSRLSDFALMKTLKSKYDGAGVFAPGRYLGGL